MDRAMQQWEASLKRPDLSERDRVRGAIDAFSRQMLANELLARRSSPDREMVVKPLEWEPDHVGGGLRAGEYRLRAGVWTHGYYWVRGDDEPHTGYVEEDEAKAAAQADYEARILAALEAKP